MLYVNDGGVVLGPGAERSLLRDTNLDVDDAWLLAAAILECCDQMDGAR